MATVKQMTDVWSHHPEESSKPARLEHRLVPRDIPIHGFILDVKSGGLVEVPQATRYGMAA
jgi:hypothetical protein